MTERGFAWAVASSLAVHAVGFAAATSIETSAALAPRPAVAIELVSAPAPEPPPPPPPAPARAKPVPPRMVMPAAAPRPVDREPQTTTPNLLDAPAAPRASTPVVDSAAVPSAMPAASGPIVAAPSGLGRVSSAGDLLVPPGPSGGSGGSGPGGTGRAPAGPQGQVVATGTGLTALARPLGGYQTKPTYPDAARRDRAEGVVTLRFEVLTTGAVGEVAVVQSAGRRDLDRAAIEAIRHWQFEPARRGATAVAVWVTLPVTFELTDR